MVKLRFNGDEETFFHVDGLEYRTKNKLVDVPSEVAEKMLSNPRFEVVKPKKKKNQDGGVINGCE